LAQLVTKHEPARFVDGLERVGSIAASRHAGSMHPPTKPSANRIRSDWMETAGEGR
jgi:hypothetical protein